MLKQYINTTIAQLKAQYGLSNDHPAIKSLMELSETNISGSDLPFSFGMFVSSDDFKSDANADNEIHDRNCDNCTDCTDDNYTPNDMDFSKELSNLVSEMESMLPDIYKSNLNYLPRRLVGLLSTCYSYLEEGYVPVDTYLSIKKEYQELMACYNASKR